jgi:FixJ family two-component response regulator
MGLMRAQPGPIGAAAPTAPARMIRRVDDDQARLRVPTNPNALISIVDDDESVREAVEGLIESLGLRVRVFHSAIEFLACPEIGETSCMITDIHMPHMSGLDLCRRLGELGHSIPTILITAYPNDAVRDRVLAAGVVGYLVKPFDDDALIRCVRSALRNTPGPTG